MNLTSTISPEYDECPAYCFRRESSNGNFCENCDIKQAYDIFKECTLELLDERFGNDWKDTTFEELVITANRVINLEDDDRSEWSTVTETLFDVYIGQRNRIKRIEDWNFRQKIKNKDG